jgi:fructan beta-fructosidase
MGKQVVLLEPCEGPGRFRRGIFIGLIMLVGVAATLQMRAQESTPWSPVIHLYAPPNWINDPNGPILVNGQYNVFFQSNPFGDQWGHMSWGHAVSTDLAHWNLLPVAIPEENGVMIFSGSTVEDRDNTSGLCPAPGQKTPGCLVAIYTARTAADPTKDPPVPEHQAQHIAWSWDAGLGWTEYSGNPVLDLGLKDFRDPKVIWHAPSKSWVMVVALPDRHKVRFYRSKNLIKWELASEFGPAGAVGGVWECPDLMELKVVDWKGRPEGSRWVLNVNLNPGGVAGGSGDQYFVGDFDGSGFTEDHPGSGPHWVDRGKDFYAATSFANIPGDQDRLMIAWMSNWLYADKLPSLPGRGEMTVARRVFLRDSAPRTVTSAQESLALVQHPVLPVPQQKQDTAWFGNAKYQSVADANAHLAAAKLQGSVYLLRLTLAAGDTAEAGVRLRRSSLDPTQDATEETVVGIDRISARIFVDRSHSGRTDWAPGFSARVWAPLRHPQAVAISMEIVVDHNSIEVFAEDGETVLTDLIYPAATSTGLAFYASQTPPGSAPATIGNVEFLPLDHVSK